MVPCIGGQAAEHVCEGGQSQSTGLLNQQRVLIRRLLCIVLERHALPPQPIKLTLFELVPHWKHQMKHLAVITVTDTAELNSHNNSPSGALMWSIEATRCRFGRAASCPSALWVFSPRSIGPSMLWIIKYTWKSGPAKTSWTI